MSLPISPADGPCDFELAGPKFQQRSQRNKARTEQLLPVTGRVQSATEGPKIGTWQDSCSGREKQLSRATKLPGPQPRGQGPGSELCSPGRNQEGSHRSTVLPLPTLTHGLFPILLFRKVPFLIYGTLGQLLQVFSSWPLIISQLLPPEHCQAKQGSPRHRSAACRPGHRQADELSYVHQTCQTRMRQTAVPGHYANLDLPNGKPSASSKHLVSYTYTHIPQTKK